MYIWVEVYKLYQYLNKLLLPIVTLRFITLWRAL
jgi:hypothetical protein